MKSIIKKLLSNKFFLLMVVVKDEINYYRIKYSSKNRLFVFISMLFNRSYIDEHEAVLKGSYWHEKKIRDRKVNVYYLRRNIHRIEKGLLMRPLRNEFGLRFILPTVESFNRIVVEKNSDIAEWGEDVLNEYFNITSSIDRRYIDAKNKFLESRKVGNTSAKEKKIPYSPLKKTNEIKFNQFEKMLESRKSIRWFKKDLINKDDIKKALSIAKLAPSSCNRQPYRYVITTNPGKASQLASVSGGTAGWSGNIPALAILIGRQKSFTNAINRHSIYIDSTLTVMPFILALDTLGLSTCIINWVDIPNKVKLMKKELLLDDDEKIIMSIAIGYSDEQGKVACSQRMPNEKISTFL